MGGKFYGVGVGPGDPELLTLKAVRVLGQIDVLCVPKSNNDRESLALTVAGEHLNSSCRVMELSFPMTKDSLILAKCWARAGETVAGMVQEGLRVAMVTIGDPMFYSTYGYVLGYLKMHYPDLVTETVPGITAMNACCAKLQSPLAEGDESVAVLPATYGVDKLKDILNSFDNVVLMKVNRKLDEVTNLLKETGNLDRAVLFNRCGYREGFFARGGNELAGVKADYMSLMIVKKRGFKGHLEVNK